LTFRKWLFDAYEQTYYQSVIPATEGGEVRLEAPTRVNVAGANPSPGTASNPADQTVVPDDRVHHVRNVCEAAGAVEAGDLVPVPQGTPLKDRQVVAIATPETIHHLPADVAGYSPDETAAAAYELGSLSPHAVYQTPRPDGVGGGDSNEVGNGEDEPVTTTNTRLAFESEDQSVQTRYIPTSETSRWTFDVDAYRRWVEHHLPPGGTVINACAGRNRLHHDGEVIRVDINADNGRDIDIVCDVAALAAEIPNRRNDIDAIVYDAPWSQYQSNLRYQDAHVFAKGPANGKSYANADERPVETEIDLRELPFEVEKADQEQIGHAWLAKRNFYELLRPGGIIIQLSQHGTLMPATWGYSRVSRILFDPIGEAKTVIGAVDRATQQTLAQFE